VKGSSSAVPVVPSHSAVSIAKTGPPLALRAITLLVLVVQGKDAMLAMLAVVVNEEVGGVSEGRAAGAMTAVWSCVREG
jgi:hypothetical protein